MILDENSVTVLVRKKKATKASLSGTGFSVIPDFHW